MKNAHAWLQVVGLAALAQSGCIQYETKAVHLDDLRGALAARSKVVAATDGENARITSFSALRFERVDHTFTPWFHASELVFNAAGVHAQHVLAARLTHFARITDLNEPLVDALFASLPFGASLRETSPGVWDLQLPPDVRMDQLIDRFIQVEGDRVGPSSTSLEICAAQTSANDCTQRGVMLRRYWLQRSSVPLGSWRFELPQQRLTAPVTSEALFDIGTLKFQVIDGLQWSDIADVEVSNVQRGRTAVASIAVILFWPLTLSHSSSLFVFDRTQPSPAATRSDAPDQTLWQPNFTQPQFTADAQPFVPKKVHCSSAKARRQRRS